MLALLIVVALETPYPNVSVGDSWQGEARFLYSAVDRPSETDLTVWKEGWKVASVSDGVVTLNCSRVMTENAMDGKPVPVPADSKPLTWTERWSQKGVERDPIIEEPIDLRLWRMRLLPPLGVPWAWPASSKMPAANAEMRIDRRAVAGPDGPSIRGWFNEDGGIQATITGVIDPKSSWPISGKIEAKRVPMPGGDGTPFNLVIEWKTIKLEVKGRQ